VKKKSESVCDKETRKRIAT